MKQYNSTSIKNIRIIGGRWRGRKLLVPKNQGLRPTLNRVRETLFNWLSPSIVNAKCLDCFSGSGALGLEALSRYAASVTFLEIKRSYAQCIWHNLSVLKASGSNKVINIDAFTYLAKTGTPHEIAFVDPPFRQGFLEKTISLLEENGWLCSSSFIFTESEFENSLLKIPENWTLYHKKLTGQVSYRLYHRKI